MKNSDYDMNELKLDIDEAKSTLKILQFAIGNEHETISFNDIINSLEVTINKLNIIQRNINYM